MAIVTTIDAVRDWIEENICPQVSLKVPDNDVVDEGYEYRLTHPAAFSMYMPTEDKLPEGVTSTIPSITVRVMDGTDSLTDGTREMRVTLLFATWSPGLHAQDYLSEVKVEKNGLNTTYTATQKYSNSERRFDMDAEGWRDAWNFVDTAVRIIENHEFLGDYRFVKEKGLSFKPVSAEAATPDTFPFWFANVEFYISEAISVQRRHVHYDELL